MSEVSACLTENAEFTASSAAENHSSSVDKLEKLCRQAADALAQGKCAQSIGLYRQALGLKLRQPEIWNWLGLAMAQGGAVHDAAAAFRQAIEVQPRFAQAWQNLGVALGHTGDYGASIRAFRKALAVDPDYYEARLNLASTLARQKDPADAIDAYQDVLRLRPDSIEALNGVGFALASSGRNEEAVALLRHALELDPDAITPRNNLAAALADDGNYTAAEEQFAEILRQNPEHIDTLVNRGNMLKEQGRLGAAIESYDEALRRRPGNNSAAWNRSLALLQTGDFIHGWAAYESRLERRETDDSRPCPGTPPWQGESIEGCTILLQSEQGLGDTIQFVRYAAMLKERGAAKVELHCPTPLIEVMKGCLLLDGVIPEGATLPAFDQWVHLMSLPHRCGTTLETVPTMKYLVPDPVRVQRWKDQIGPGPAVKIGVSWQGNPHHRWDRHRSVPLSCFASLAELSCVRLFSIQRGPGTEQLKRVAFEVADFLDAGASEAGSVADQLALAACMDLVISVDTMTAHLAGAAGVRTWVALSKMVDWRWLQDQDTTPWYPSMRLFRQDQRGVWPDVFDAIKREVCQTFPQAREPRATEPVATKAPDRHSSGRPLLSLCMIVRDASQTLAACLRSIKPWVDEIVIVDTGSSDDTVSIAESYGARVSSFTWVDDFAAARNESLRLATGEWIFWMDADDTIDAVEGARLRGLVEDNQETAVAYVVQVHCPGTNGEQHDLTVVDHIKLFRNLPGVRFEGRIHEQVLPSIRRLRGEVVWTNVHVIHSGADQSPAGRARKQERDLRLLRLDVSDRPNHSFVLFNYGMTLSDAGHNVEAVEWLRKSVRLGNPGESHLRKAYALLAGALALSGQSPEALETCGEGLAFFADDTELSFRAGLLSHQLGLLDEALAHYRRALRGPSIRRFASVDPALGGYKAQFNMAAVLQDLGRSAEAEAAYREVVLLAPGWSPAREALNEIEGRPQCPRPDIVSDSDVDVAEAAAR